MTGKRDMVAGCKMPSNYSMTHREQGRRLDAEMGCERLAAAIQGYIDKGGRMAPASGLPNAPECD